MTFIFCNVKITELVSQSRMKLFVGVLLDFSSRNTKSYIAVVYIVLCELMFIDPFLFTVNLVQIVYVQWGGWLSFNAKFCHSHFTDLESSSLIAELWSAIDCCWVVECGRKNCHISVMIQFLVVFSVTLKKELEGAESKEQTSPRTR